MVTSEVLSTPFAACDLHQGGPHMRFKKTHTHPRTGLKTRFWDIEAIDLKLLKASEDDFFCCHQEPRLARRVGVKPTDPGEPEQGDKGGHLLLPRVLEELEPRLRGFLRGLVQGFYPHLVALEAAVKVSRTALAPAPLLHRSSEVVQAAYMKVRTQAHFRQPGRISFA